MRLKSFLTSTATPGWLQKISEGHSPVPFGAKKFFKDKSESVLRKKCDRSQRVDFDINAG
jgi:hypothetical protein